MGSFGWYYYANFVGELHCTHLPLRIEMVVLGLVSG